jgi:hypothetical protein
MAAREGGVAGLLQLHVRDGTNLVGDSRQALAQRPEHTLSVFQLPGYGYYPLYMPGHPLRAAIETFIRWLGEIARYGARQSADRPS